MLRRRSLLAQRRLGILPLRRTFQKKRLKIEYCNSQYVENVEHVICVCTMYSQLRNNLYLKVENAGKQTCMPS